jgi:hypothetical protein
MPVFLSIQLHQGVTIHLFGPPSGATGNSGLR